MNKRLLLRIAVPAVLLFLCIFTLIKYNELAIYDDIDNIAFTNESDKARIFEHEYPTAEQISDYLSDATIVYSYDMSKPDASKHVYENKIIYLDTDHHYYQWRAAGKNVSSFDAGSWSIRDRFMISKFRGRRRYQWVQLFCRHDKYLAPQYQIDNCRIAYELVPLFSRGYKQVYDYKKGNAFNISEGTKLPFEIPVDSPASFDKLLALYRLSTK